MGRCTWRAYISLLRPRYHLSYVVVVLGCLVVSRGLTAGLIFGLAELYLSFNVLLYGGIYTLNAICDADLDRLHPRKRWRPLPSGLIAPRHALRFGVLLIFAGVGTTYALFPAGIAYLCTLALLLNLLYSVAVRGVPYLDIAMNAVTHPLRFALGMLLAGGQVRWPLLLLVFLIAAGVSTLRRRLELLNDGSSGRPALHHYSSGRLLALEAVFGAAIGVLWLLDGSTNPTYYFASALGYMVLVLAPELHPPTLRQWHRVWTV